MNGEVTEEKLQEAIKRLLVKISDLGLMMSLKKNEKERSIIEPLWQLTKQ